MSGPRVDDKIVSYGDAVLRRSDIDILRGPRFINDRLIEFFFAHLSSTHPSAGAGRFLLVPPSISFWISLCPDTTSRIEAAAPLRLRDRDLVLFTVNNNADVTLAEGGTHWSLLVTRGATMFSSITIAVIA
ncbi:NEDD8-specific protease 1 [Platanthera guangdongensis]|uniref:NEDD8-specific protease 1 n=1 Tax=Platanthera guangdongensis TaxID=2320717 RepID=A0ABR2LY19_9ASPA